MLRYLTKSALFVCILSGVLADVLPAKEDGIVSADTAEPRKPPSVLAMVAADNPVEEAIRELESHAAAIDVVDEERAGVEEDMERLTEHMVALLNKIMELMTEPNNVYKFIEAKGVERVILPHLQNYNIEFRSQLLSMTKLLFEIAPKTTSVVIPIEVLDKLLDIFEEDDALVLKGKIIDILYAWLPGNPKVQARVMKLKGLDAFYDQVHKLDATIIETKLKLLSTLLKEHIKVRKQNLQETKADVIRLNIYKRIGLIERIATARVCIGLMNIFHASVNPAPKYYMTAILDILIEIEPYCSEHYVKQTKAAQFFRDLEKHVKEMNEITKLHYEMQGLNLTQIVAVVDKYVEAMKYTRDEF